MQCAFGAEKKCAYNHWQSYLGHENHIAGNISWIKYMVQINKTKKIDIKLDDFNFRCSNS